MPAVETCTLVIRSADNEAYLRSEFAMLLDEVAEWSNGRSVVIGGDFNAWVGDLAEGLQGKPNSRGKWLLALM